jgi:MerR family mercuric resistance operon transcriptional regulator
MPALSISTLSIGDLARRTGVPVETIRYYERMGLLPKPPRTEGNYRAYEATHERRLAFVKRSRDLGFGLDAIRALLDLADGADRSCGEVDALARDQLAEVERKIADLTAMRAELQDMLGHCRNDTVADCEIIGRLRGR